MGQKKLNLKDQISLDDFLKMIKVKEETHVLNLSKVARSISAKKPEVRETQSEELIKE